MFNQNDNNTLPLKWFIYTMLLNNIHGTKGEQEKRKEKKKESRIRHLVEHASKYTFELWINGIILFLSFCLLFSGIGNVVKFSNRAGCI